MDQRHVEPSQHPGDRSWLNRCLGSAASVGALVSLLWATTAPAQAMEPLPHREAMTQAQVFSQGSAIAPSKRVLIEQLLTMTRQEELFNQTQRLTLDQVMESLPDMLQGIAGDSLDPELLAAGQVEIERIVAKLVPRLQARLPFAELAEEVYYPLYAQNFTEAQLADMIAFYETPTGQYTIEAMPQLLQDSMVLTQQRFMPAMIEVLQEVMAEEFGL